jgi:hypothetical protein
MRSAMEENIDKSQDLELVVMPSLEVNTYDIPKFSIDDDFEKTQSFNYSKKTSGKKLLFKLYSFLAC